MSAFIQRKEQLIDDAIADLAIQGEQVTYVGIMDMLEPIERANLAILEIERRAKGYHANMRRFFDIALPIANAADVLSEGYGEVVASISALHDFVGGVKTTTARERGDVLADIRREWRMLGWEEARVWEPLYTLVTGRELVNE
ncbi:MAG: hypothetical protein Q9168_006491 [Polycauliona sp. 1 TL-2023]